MKPRTGSAAFRVGALDGVSLSCGRCMRRPRVNEGHQMTHVLAMGMPGPFEMVIIAGLGLLIFGKRLPDVGRNVALAIKGFQKGLKDVSDLDADDAADGRKSLPDKK